MNWITKFIKPKIKSLFEKRSSRVEENLWTTCSCKNLIYKEDMDSNLKVCPKCGEHHKPVNGQPNRMRNPSPRGHSAFRPGLEQR